MIEREYDLRGSGPQSGAEAPRWADSSTRLIDAANDAGAELRMICICVDDFGLQTGVNLAALQLASKGRVHAVSCRVGGDLWKTWGKLLRRLDADGMDLGLNLDLTEHRLLSGTAPGFEALVAASHGRTLSRPRLRDELRAQFDAFEHVIGHAPAFVGSHRHVHQLPVVRDELLDEIERRYGAYRPWLRSTVTHPNRAVVPASGGWRERVLRWCVEQSADKGLAALANRRGFPQNRHLLGVYDRQNDHATYALLLRMWLRQAVDGDLLVCRPSAGQSGNAAMLRAAIEEFEMLSSDAFATLLEASGITLWPMSKVLFGRALA